MNPLTWLRDAWSSNSSILPLGSSDGGGGARLSVNKRRFRTLALFTLLSLLLLLLIFYFALFSESSTLLERPDRAENDSTGDTRKYGVVIDAGSSGSRAMIYAWDDPALQQHSNATAAGGLPVIERASAQWTYKTTPGISSFADRPRRVGTEHLKPLLDFAAKHIPERQIPHTPVYLLATAGMRLLPRSHQSLILDTACSFARANYEFQLPDCQESFQVVSGELEGLYGWVAVNYLMDGFSAGQVHSLGFLDMGGASAQIAFEPAKVAAQVHKHDLAEVTLRNLDGQDYAYSVFVATFLGHGTNEARRRYVEQLKDTAIAGGADTPIIDDPCLATGLALPTLDGKVVLRGKGRFSECIKATEPLLNKTACPIEPCLFAGVHAPEIDFGTQQFVGVSEYWYASHDYLGLGGVWDVDRFEKKARDFCQKPWAEISSHSTNNEVKMARLQMQCFKAAWLVNVLHSGFGVPRSLPASASEGKLATPFQSVNQVGDVEVSWTLGALLLKVSQTIKPNYQTIKAKSTPGIRLPDNPSVVEEGVELVDDSLWSPLKFVGMWRLYILWSLQPTGIRILLALALLATLGMLSGLVCWLFTHRRVRQKRPALSNGIPLSPIGTSARLDRNLSMPNVMPSASQLGLAETLYSQGDSASNESESDDGAKQLRRSPSMFVMDILSRPLQAAGISVASQPSTPKLRALQVDASSGPGTPSPGSGAGEHRARSVALVAEDTPMSRSSSVNSLVLLNRRRGGGPD